MTLFIKDLIKIFTFIYFFFILGLLIKIGIVLGNFWLGDVSEGIDIFSFIVVNTILKLVILLKVKLIFDEVFVYYTFFFFFVWLGLLCYIIGIFLTLFQQKVIRFLSFSSLTHLGLVLTLISIFNSFNLIQLYLVVYFLILLHFVDCWTSSIYYNNFIEYIANFSLTSRLQSLMFPILLDIGGFPPYTLFILKFIIIFFLVFNNYIILSIVLGFLSVIVSYYYLKLIKNNYFLILPRSISLINTEDKVVLFYHYAIICYVLFLSIPS